MAWRAAAGVGRRRAQRARRQDQGSLTHGRQRQRRQQQQQRRQLAAVGAGGGSGGGGLQRPAAALGFAKDRFHSHWQLPWAMGHGPWANAERGQWRDKWQWPGTGARPEAGVGCQRAEREGTACWPRPAESDPLQHVAPGTARGAWHGTWHTAHGTWHLSHDMAHGAWRMAHGTATAQGPAMVLDSLLS